MLSFPVNRLQMIVWSMLLTPHHLEAMTEQACKNHGEWEETERVGGEGERERGWGGGQDCEAKQHSRSLRHLADGGY